MDANLPLLIWPTIMALVFIFAPQWQIRHIEKRMQAGDDRYLDEQRSYPAYPWQRNAKALRVTGLVTLGLDAVYLGVTFLGP